VKRVTDKNFEITELASGKTTT